MSNATSFQAPVMSRTSGSTTSGSGSSDGAGLDEEANVNDAKVTYFAETEPDVAIANTSHQPYFPALVSCATELSSKRRVSIIIPLYNEEGFTLERTIVSMIFAC